MKNPIRYALLALILCSSSSTFSMHQHAPGSQAVLAELMQTIARRKAQKKLEKGLAHRRERIEDSDSDTLPDDTDIMASAHIPAAPPAPLCASDSTPVRPSRSNTDSSATTAPENSPASSSSDETTSSEDEGFESDLSDIEQAPQLDVKQVPYSTGVFGHTLATPEGLIAHLQTRQDSENPLERCFQHAVGQHLDNALLAHTQSLDAHIRAQDGENDFVAQLTELARMKAIVEELNHMKELAEYHGLIASPAQIARAEQVVREYRGHIERTKQRALQEVEAQDASLSTLWGAQQKLDRLKRLKRAKIGIPAHTAAMDTVILSTAQALQQAVESDAFDDHTAIIQQARELMKILRGKKFPLNPHTVKQLFEALIALEAKIAEEREEATDRTLMEQYDVERVADALAAYVEQEAAQHTLSGAQAGDADACPTPDERDDTRDII